MSALLKSGAKRRLAFEQLCVRKYGGIAKAIDALNIFCDINNICFTFKRETVRMYILCRTDMSMKRLKVVARFLNCSDIAALDEVFVAPKVRGIGDLWVGETSGKTVRDIDTRAITDLI